MMKTTCWRFTAAMTRPPSGNFVAQIYHNFAPLWRERLK